MLNFTLLDHMIWIDYAISVLILASAVFGLFRGLMREVFALATWIAAIWVGMHYCRDFSPLLQSSVSYVSAQIAITFAGLSVLTLLVGSLISYLLQHLIDNAGLSAGNRLTGMLFGLLRGAVLVAVVVMLAGLTPIPEDPWWKHSVLLPPFQSLAVWLKTFIPAELAGYINFR